MWRRLVRDLGRGNAIAAVALASTACDGGTNPLPRDPADLTFAPSLGVDLDAMTLSSTGLYYQTVEEGVGTEVAEAGDTVDVDFTGWLHTGTQFDSSAGVDPLRQRVGVGALISGFDEGILGMRLDETRLLVIPHQLGYGSQRLGPIPPFSTLVFRVTLVGLQKAGA